MSKNASYKYSTNLPSLYIDKKLLENLEDYFFIKIPTILNISKEVIKEKFRVVIKDSNGEEEFNSIKEYISNTFPNDTKEISLGLYYSNSEKNELASIWVYLNQDKIGAKIRSEINNKSPKETTQGILSGLNQILIQNKNNNWLFYPAFMVEIIIGMSGLLCFSVSVNIYKSNSKLSILLFSISLLIFFYAVISKKLKPYISFDSNKQRKYNRTTTWFFYGFLTFIIFGNLFAFFRDILFK